MRRSRSETPPRWSRSVARSSRKPSSARTSVPGMRHPSLPSHRTIAPSSPRPRTVSWRGGISGAARRRGRWRIETGLAPALAVSPDGLTAAVGIKHGVQLVDLRAGTVRTAAGDSAGSPSWVLFSPDGKMVVATNRDKTVTRWDVASATPLETLRGHSNFVQQPVFSPDGQTLYTVSHDGTAIAWDLTGDRRLGRPFTFTHDRTFSETGFDGHPGRLSPDGRLIAVGLKEQGVALWDARELTPVGAPLLETGGEVKSLAFSPDGRTLAAVTETHAHALGCPLAIAAPRAALRGEPVYGARRRLQPGRSDARYGEQRPRPALWDAATGDSLDDPRIRWERERRCLQRRRCDDRVRPDAREARRSGMWPRARRSPRSTATPRPRLFRRAQPRRALPGGRWLRQSRTRLGRPHPEARPRARPGRQRRVYPRVQPGRPDSRNLRIRARRVPLGRCDRNPDRPAAHRRGPQDDDRSLGRRTPAVGGSRQRPGGCLGRRPRVLEAPGLRPRQPHADPRGVGGVSPRAALRAGLREPESDSGANRPGEARQGGRRSEAAGA